MNQPSPAIVPQLAVRRLPRLALWLFALAYVLPGFIGRSPWRQEDMAAFGYMLELARGQADWLAPTLQYLPVRILIRQDAETHLDLVLKRAPLQAAPESTDSPIPRRVAR